MAEDESDSAITKLPQNRELLSPPRQKGTTKPPQMYDGVPISEVMARRTTSPLPPSENTGTSLIETTAHQAWYPIVSPELGRPISDRLEARNILRGVTEDDGTVTLTYLRTLKEVGHIDNSGQVPLAILVDTRNKTFNRVVYTSDMKITDTAPDIFMNDVDREEVTANALAQGRVDALEERLNRAERKAVGTTIAAALVTSTIVGLAAWYATRTAEYADEIMTHVLQGSDAMNDNTHSMPETLRIATTQHEEAKAAQKTTIETKDLLKEVTSRQQELAPLVAEYAEEVAKAADLQDRLYTSGSILEMAFHYREAVEKAYNASSRTAVQMGRVFNKSTGARIKETYGLAAKVTRQMKLSTIRDSTRYANDVLRGQMIGPEQQEKVTGYLTRIVAADGLRRKKGITLTENEQGSQYLVRGNSLEQASANLAKTLHLGTGMTSTKHAHEFLQGVLHKTEKGYVLQTGPDRTIIPSN